MLVIKKKINTIKNNLVKRIMLAKNLPESYNFLKITTPKMLLKAFLTSTYITTQSRCRLKKV